MDGHGFEERGSRRTYRRWTVHAWRRFDYARGAGYAQRERLGIGWFWVSAIRSVFVAQRVQYAFQVVVQVLALGGIQRTLGRLEHVFVAAVELPPQRVAF